MRPEKRPVLVQLRPWTEPPVRVAPLGLTDPELNSPESDPPEITKRSVLLPHGVPVATATQVPSKLPPPLPLARDARRGSSDAGLARRAGRDDSTSRGFSREPDSDFSSLPILPPALPDCACAALVGSAAATRITQKAILIERRTVHGIIEAFQSFGLCPDNYCFAAVHRPVQPSDWRNVPPPVRPDRRPVVMIVMPWSVEVPYTFPSGLTVPLAF